MMVGSARPFSVLKQNVEIGLAKQDYLAPAVWISKAFSGPVNTLNVPAVDETSWGVVAQGPRPIAEKWTASTAALFHTHLFLWIYGRADLLLHGWKQPLKHHSVDGSKMTHPQLYQSDTCFYFFPPPCCLHSYGKAAFCLEELMMTNPHNHLYCEQYAEVGYPPPPPPAMSVCPSPSRLTRLGSAENAACVTSTHRYTCSAACVTKRVFLHWKQSMYKQWCHRLWVKVVSWRLRSPSRIEAQRFFWGVWTEPLRGGGAAGVPSVNYYGSGSPPNENLTR